MSAIAARAVYPVRASGCRERRLGPHLRTNGQHQPRRSCLVARAGESYNSVDDLLQAMWRYSSKGTAAEAESKQPQAPKQMPLEYYCDPHYWTHGVGQDVIDAATAHLEGICRSDPTLYEERHLAMRRLTHLIHLLARKSPSLVDEYASGTQPDGVPLERMRGKRSRFRGSSNGGLTDIALCLRLCILARVAALTPSVAGSDSLGSFVRPTHEWIPPVDNPEADVEEAIVMSLAQHLLEEYPNIPPLLRQSLAYNDYGEGAVFCSDAAHRVALTFSRIYVEAGRGGSIRKSLQENVSSSLTKAMVNNFSSATTPNLANTNPLKALRQAQAAAFGAHNWCSDAICEARLGSEFGTDDKEEEFIQTAIQWVSQHQDDIQEPGRVKLALDFALEMYRLKEGNYKLAGRTPNKLYQAMEAFSLSTVQFDKEYDEVFQPNPVGIKGYWANEVSIPEGTAVYVPYEGPTMFSSRADAFDLEQLKEFNYRRSFVKPPPRKMTVRIAEILSMQRLFHEGAMLGNCLENRQRSQIKYLMRIRQRTSSYWSMTFILPEDEKTGSPGVSYQCLVEVWHLRSGNVIHQAEGPRPRTLPTPEAWYFLSKWCEQENLDLTQWECYS